MTITFVDSGVLITAFRGKGEDQKTALAILDDSKRKFASSEFVRLEVLPKAVYHKNTAEVEFYETFFKAVEYWAGISVRLVQEAYQEACRSGLSAIDALHVAAAVSTNADELVTTERVEKPLHRTKQVRVVSILKEE